MIIRSRSAPLKIRKPPLARKIEPDQAKLDAGVAPTGIRKPPKVKGRWGSVVERERKRRIDLAVWAYAYEVLNVALVSDAVFDETCKLVDPNIKTGNFSLDVFFRKHFNPNTGLWVHKHPHKKRLAELAHRRIRLASTT